MTTATLTRSGPASAASAATRGLRRLALLVPVGVGVLAFAVRLGVTLRGGGLLGVGGYDDGVYFAAGAALVHGRLPYAGFLFLHPPGVVLATAPFAALGAVVGDPTAFAAARLVFELVGAVNAVLIVLLLRRFGIVGALIGGVLYAVLMPAAWTERSVLLEPLGTLGVLAALLLLRGRPSAARVLIAGAAAGAAADVKIWYVVPVLVIASLASGQRGRFLLGAAAAITAVCLPFFLADPAAMVQEVLLDQLGRGRNPALVLRAAGVLGAQPFTGLSLRSVTAVLALTAAAAFVATLLTRGARVFAVMLAADAAVLLASPSWFEHYGALTAPPLALCAGVAAQQGLNRIPRASWRAAAAALLAAAVLAGALHVTSHARSGTAVPAAFRQAVQTAGGCVVADDPTVLIVSDVLTRDLARPGCALWPDLTGWTYDPRTLPGGGRRPSRLVNPAWQRLAADYLRSGDAFVRSRASTALDAATGRLLDAEPVLAAHGRWVLHRSRPR